MRELREWTSERPVDSDGRPANELVAELLALMFEQPGRSLGLDAIASELFCDRRQVLSLIQQLRTLNILEETAGHSLLFRTSARPWNRRLFARVAARFSRLEHAVCSSPAGV